MDLPFKNTHLKNVETRELVVHSSNCNELADFGIALMGVTDAVWPYAMSNVCPKRCYLLVCTGGEGRAWSRGRWEACGPGDAYLCPAGEAHAYGAREEGGRWQFAWVIYDSRASWHNFLPEQSMRVAGANGHALTSAIKGLYREISGISDRAMRQRWAGLIEAYWRMIGLAEARSGQGRLLPLWEKVDQSLAHPWTLAELASDAGFSEEHLRRIAKEETGRSPMMQVTWLRMSRAAILIQTTPLKIEAIAEMVGYSSPFAFSTAFQRVMGCPPSRYVSQ